MKKYLFSVLLVSLTLVLIGNTPALCSNVAVISATEYKAGDTVTIEGTIDPGQDLFIAVSSQKTFAPKDTKGIHETKRLNKDAKDPAIQKLINRDLDNGRQSDVRGTPAVFVNGKRLKNRSLAGFQQAIDAELKKM